MRPTPRTTPDEWARRNRVYKPSAGIPGPRDPGLTPYMVPFARAFDVAHQVATYGQRFDALVQVTSSQSGKTDTVLDVIGATFDQRPAPIMYVGPSKDFLKREIEPRVMDLLTGAPRLKERLATGKRMTLFRKSIGGVPLVLAWAGSGSSFRGTAAKVAIVDELDDMAASIEGNGDPFTLVESRGASFRDRIKAAISTPLTGSVEIERDEASGLEFWKVMAPEDVASPIWRLFQSGTRHHFAWPCPCCGEFFVPRFKQLRWPEGAGPAEARRAAYIECPRCGGVIEEAHKRAMNARGVYVAPGQSVDADGIVTGPLPDTTILSFWASGLCSPMLTFGERAASYVTAKLSGEQAKIQAAINTGFGECFAPGSGDVPEWEEVARCKRPYAKGELPDGVKVLTLAADVQRRRILYTIRGWGDRGASWLVDYGELHGHTTENEVWSKLGTLITTPIGDLSIHRAFIDSGFRPGKPENVPVNKVYEFCRRFPRRVYATKGKATQDKPLIVSKHEVTQRGEARKYGLDLIWLDTDHFKSWVHERIRWPDDEPGFWAIPEDTSDDYCKQIVSEARVRKPSGAPTWVQRSRENHYLDCEAMQAGLAHLISAHLLRGSRSPGGETTAETIEPDAPPRTPPDGAPAAPRPAAKPQLPAPAAQPDQSTATARSARRKRLADLTNRIYGA